MDVGVNATQSASEPPAEAGPSGEDVVEILDEDSAPPPSSGGCYVMMAQCRSWRRWRRQRALFLQ
jgi:hypothetical protein